MKLPEYSKKEVELPMRPANMVTISTHLLPKVKVGVKLRLSPTVQ